MNGLTAALPLSAAEKGITRNASRTLIAAAAHVRGAVGTAITTPAALTEFWRSHTAWSARNLAACTAVSNAIAADVRTLSAPETQPPPAKPAHGIRSARARTKPKPAAKATSVTRAKAVARAKPAASAKAKTRGAGG